MSPAIKDYIFFFLVNHSQYSVNYFFSNPYRFSILQSFSRLLISFEIMILQNLAESSDCRFFCELLFS
ncbi:hypothetical protein OIU79_008270 [Salix purpurea]|uniref:Uncharacterized protein n=1 Tax=Salix purpurea TaxID=77065 RepID=A0A9Q0YW17_SALPP|nr:hypothetical protein OIU79_008270 [Salix purpurea]